jgi:EAL domain-containing protein (putative c-di-GMP-specific phosphodiesterase class I)
MRARVAAALERDAVTLAYQPVVYAVAPERTAFHEGLVRLADRRGRPLRAQAFVPACEACETGRALDRRSLALALDALAARPDLRLSVNMSARSIADPRWTACLEARLERAPALAERLIVEITEQSAMACPRAATAWMERLRRCGVAFALDDFGTGATAFRHLRDFAFDVVKIPRSFASGVAGNHDAQVLVEALVTIADRFDMLSVAEGVEEAADAAALMAMGVDCLQGYAFGLPASEPRRYRRMSELAPAGGGPARPL